MKLTEEWFRQPEQWQHYLSLVPDMINDITEEATIRMCCNYEEFAKGHGFIMKELLENQEKAEKWDNARKEWLVFGDKEWALDSIYDLKQENKELRDSVAILEKHARYYNFEEHEALKEENKKLKEKVKLVDELDLPYIIQLLKEYGFAICTTSESRYKVALQHDMMIKILERKR